MKYRLGIWLFLLTYLIASFQVVVQVHICEKEGVELHFFAVEDPDCCAEAEAPMACHIMGDECPFAPQPKPGCCETEQLDFSVEQPQLISEKLTLVDFVALELPTEPISIEEPQVASARLEMDLDLPPPRAPLWRRYCAALTYG